MLTKSEQSASNAGSSGSDHGTTQDFAIRATSLVKTYKLYPTPGHQVRDMLGIDRLFSWNKQEYPVHRALDDVTLTIRPGERLGVIGRNGAGKTTLLKLISGSAEPTEGTIEVNGDVQALMQVGVGFHPEFSGAENIRASLLYSGLTSDQRKEAEADIIEFCELGDFLEQPLKTYSLGMQSRLQFACATAIKPEILIVDEILGAGDAYFAAKSAQRMEKLALSGCTLLLVSHSMGQIMQFCDQAMWIESGQVAATGSSRDIVNQYEKFIHELQRKSKLVDADKLANSNQSEWLKEKTLEAMHATQKAAAKSGGESGGERAAEDINRWPQDDSPIEIASVCVRDGDGEECGLFRVGDPITFEIEIKSLQAGRYPCRYCIVLFAADGRLMTRHVSGWFEHDMGDDDRRIARLEYDSLLLGTGDYFFSLAVYERLNLRNMTDYRWYDLHTRAYDFRIADDPIDPVSLVHHPNRWALVDAPPDEGEVLKGPDYDI